MNWKILMLLAVAALALMPGAYAYSGQKYMHSYDSYSVVFDGEGDAITYAKIMVVNNGQLALDSLELTIPGNARVYDVMQAEEGSAYGYEYHAYSREYYPQPPPAALTRVKYDVEYTDNTELTIKFDEYIPVDGQRTIVVFYKARGYAQKDFAGVYNFNFRTIVDDGAMLTQQSSVYVSVQPELSLAGVGSHVDYQMNELMTGGAMAASAEKRGEAMQSLYSGAGQFSGGVTKTGYNIDPGESFVASGYFADAWWKLYVVPLLALIGIVVGIAAFAMRFELKMPHFGKALEAMSYGFASAIATVFLLAVFAVCASGAQNSYSPLAIPLALLAFVAGICALAAFFAGGALAWRKHGVKYGALALAVTLILVLMAIAGLIALTSPPVRF